MPVAPMPVPAAPRATGGRATPTGPVPVGSYGDTWAVLPGEVHVGGNATWRYNNPGNIKWAGKSYLRGINIGHPSQLVIFPSYSEGRAALADLMHSKMYGPLTLEKMFFTYLGMKPGEKSPYGDDPEAYARGVITRTGLDGSRTVSSLNDAELGQLMDAIEIQEGYRAAGATPSQTFRPGDPNVPANLKPVVDGLGGGSAASSATPQSQALGNECFDVTWADVEPSASRRACPAGPRPPRWSSVGGTACRSIPTRSPPAVDGPATR